MFNRLNRDKRGVTGLETAIILIAFVVVASVFSFTVLSAGIFAAQQGKEAIHSGLTTAESSMQLVGSVVGLATSSTSTGVSKVTFIVSDVLNGQSLNLATSTSATSTPQNRLVINYIDQSQQVSNLPWTVKWLGKNNGDTMLDAGEQAQITVDLSPSVDPLPIAGSAFTLQVDPGKGSPLIIERTMPQIIKLVMNLN